VLQLICVNEFKATEDGRRRNFGVSCHWHKDLLRGTVEVSIPSSPYHFSWIYSWDDWNKWSTEDSFFTLWDH